MTKNFKNHLKYLFPSKRQNGDSFFLNAWPLSADIGYRKDTKPLPYNSMSKDVLRLL